MKHPLDFLLSTFFAIQYLFRGFAIDSQLQFKVCIDTVLRLSLTRAFVSWLRCYLNQFMHLVCVHFDAHWVVDQVEGCRVVLCEMLEQVAVLLAAFDFTSLKRLVLTTLVSRVPILLDQRSCLCPALAMSVVEHRHSLLQEPFDVAFVPQNPLAFRGSCVNVKHTPTLKEQQNVDCRDSMVLAIIEKVT